MSLPPSIARLRSRVGRVPLVQRVRAQQRARGSTAGPGPKPGAGGRNGDARDERIIVRLASVRWLDGATLQLHGWAYRTGDASAPDRRPVLELHERDGRLVRMASATGPDPGVNAASTDPVDHAGGAFTALVDVAALSGAEGDGRTSEFVAALEFDTAAGTFRSPFTERHANGSPGMLLAQHLPSGAHAVPIWQARTGLTLRITHHAALAEQVAFEPDCVSIEVHVRDGFAPVRARFPGGGSAPQADLQASEGGDRYRVRIPLPLPGGKDEAWTLELVDAAGRVEKVRCTGDVELGTVPLGATGRIHLARDMTVRVTRAARTVLVHEVCEQPGAGAVHPHLLVRATLHGDAAVVGASLEGRRTSVPASEISTPATGSVLIRIPLAAKAWDEVRRALPSGGYELRVRCADGSVIAPQLAPRCVGPWDEVLSSDWHNLTLTSAGGRLAISIAAPLATDERGPYHQAQLLETFRKAPGTLTGTHLESWYGKNVSDSPLAIFRELSSRGLGAPYTFGITDRSVAVPEGARGVVIGSRAWWGASTSAQHMIVNFWLRKPFVKHPGQVVVQTWHGTPYKLLGLDRPFRSGRKGSIRAIGRDTAVWDHLISQNPHSTEVFRRAYLWERPILETGYPRDDVLSSHDAGTRAHMRRVLGIADDEVAILYAPTWREDDRSKVGVLDLPRLARNLGPGYRILVRGHSVTLRSGGQVAAPSVTDVSTYPDPADLMVAADLLVTDYSSIMFDFSITGRPIIFYVPDIEEYSGSTTAGDTRKARGVYFDLAAIAPGPLVRTPRALLGAIRDRESVHRAHAQRYVEWQRRFNPHDDGRASARVVDALFPERSGDPGGDPPR